VSAPGPIHSFLPFVLLGIGVDDAFVIANAFDREREGVPRNSEDDDAFDKRGARALARAGASITVTSATDLVAFAISATSALPVLASFCAFASIYIFFLWAFAGEYHKTLNSHAQVQSLSYLMFVGSRILHGGNGY
jgi:predicted RND superfamily exporter protein